MDRIVGITALLAVSSTTAAPFWTRVRAVGYHGMATFTVVLILLFGSIVLLVLSRRQLGRYVMRLHVSQPTGRVRLFIHHLLQALAAYWNKPRVLLTAFGLGVLAILLLTTAIVLAAKSIQIVIPASIAPFAVATTAIVNTLPLAPGGLGVGETAFQTICTISSHKLSSYATAFLLYRIIYALATAPGSFIIVNIIRLR